MTWNTDISQAPRGRMVELKVMTQKGPRVTSRLAPARVILATKCGKVVLSHFIPDENDGRWEMLGKGEEPVAWQPYPEHPHSLPAAPAAADSPAFDPSASGTHSPQISPKSARRVAQ